MESQENRMVRFYILFKGLQFIPSWAAISEISKSKLSKSAFWWIVFVPIAEKVFHEIDHVNFLLEGTSYQINLSLPFQWQIFYFSSLFFAIGNGVYLLRCPEIIKSYQNYTDFSQKGNGSQRIVELFLFPMITHPEWLFPTKYKISELILFANKLTNIDHNRLLQWPREAFIGHFVKEVDIDNAKQPDAFSFSVMQLKSSHPFARLFASMAYLAAFVFLFAWLYEGFHRVLTGTDFKVFLFPVL